MILLERGRRYESKPLLDNCFQRALIRSGYPVGISHNLEFDEPSPLIVILRSNTIDLQGIKESGLRIYPTIEQLISICDKLRLYRWCQSQGIVAPTTWLLPEYYVKKHPDCPFSKQFEKDYIVKPRLPLDTARLIMLHVYNEPYNQWQIIRKHVAEVREDLVAQRRIRGDLIKAYGVLPDMFYFFSSNDKQVEPKECPPLIKRVCQFILTELGLRWGGIDFIVNEEDKLWYLIDVNPTTGGKRIPQSDWAKFQERMQIQLQEILQQKEVEKPRSLMQIVVAAAGKNTRLLSTLKELGMGGKPKTLIQLPDGSVVLDRVISMAKIFVATSGYQAKIQVLHRPEHQTYFQGWKDNRLLTTEPVELTIFDNEQLKYGDSSINHLISCLPRLPYPQYILIFPGDRLLDGVPKEEFKRCAVETYRAIHEQGYPFVVIGIPFSSSKYRYYIDSDGRILAFDRNPTQTQGRIIPFKENQEGYWFIRKLGFAFHTGKVPLTRARNSQDIVNKLINAHVPGKLILLRGVRWFGDLDTGEDLASFNIHFS